MGASRKLQGEIDRVLKKVQEGVELFDSIWNKVYDTDNANQKDKYEADLKKEIKKLQRYRDQIKTWIQSSEIKDKKVSASYEQYLLDARKQIEREMERFKVCEKEIKTKAFSKEGLGQQPKTDPKEKAKAETRDWINNVVGELESQVDNFEAEIEGLTVKKGKNRPPRLTHLETSITRHKAHIMKLELILRLLDNDQLSPEQVNDVKDFLEDYVERNQDDFDEFSDVDELYETLPLDKVEALEDLVAIGQPSLVKGGAVLKTPVDLSSSQTLAAVTLEELEGLTSMDNGVPSTASKSSLVSNSSVTNLIPVNVSSQLPIESDGAYISSSSLNITTEDDSLNLPGFVEGIGMHNINLPLNSETAVVPLVVSDYRKSDVLGADERLLSSHGMYSINNCVPQSSNSVAAGGSFTSFMAPGMLQLKSGFQNLNEMGQFRGRTEIAPDQREKFLQRFQRVQQQGPLGMQTLGGSNSLQIIRQQHNPLLQQSSALPFEVGLAPGLNVPTPASFDQPCISIHPQTAQHTYLLNAPKHLDNSAQYSAEEHNLADALTVDVSPAHRTVTASFTNVDSKASRRMGFSSSQPGVIGERVIHDVDDSLGVSTSIIDDGWPLDHIYLYKMLESALRNLPHPTDSDLSRSYTPRRAAVTPPSYPQVQAPLLSHPDFWNRIRYDTLFFAFYYQQNTYQQYMAAKALMK